MGGVAVPSLGLMKVFERFAAPLAELGTPVWCPRGLRFGREVERFAGWGARPAARAARRAAESAGLPFVALEDGFIRSFGSAAGGAVSLSVIVDDVGIYYDGLRPSRLEKLVAERPASNGDLRFAADVARFIALCREHRLTKYNGIDLLPASDRLGRDRPLVVVLDQTWGDCSVTGAGATPATFLAMLDAALDENPLADVRVRVHPEVLAGRKRGHLLDAARLRGVTVMADTWLWPSVAERAARVYAVSSQAGFDAVLRGARVTCFGLPFYAGWGLTDDRQPCARRDATAGVTLADLVGAACFRYTRYVDPYTGAPSDALATLAHLQLRQRHARRWDRPVLLTGMRSWKLPQLRPLVSNGRNAVRHIESAEAAVKAARPGETLVIWAGRASDTVLAAARERALEVIRVEDGFVRSVGLGSDHVPGHSLVFDDLGIYFDPRQPSRLEKLLTDSLFDAEMLGRAARLRAALKARRMTKYNVGRRGPLPSAPPGRVRVLVPGQVEDDASIRTGCEGITDNLGLLRAVRAARPDAWIVYKPHPDVVVGNRRGAVAPADVAALADAVVTDARMTDLFEIVDEVHTLTSLAGFEALLRGLRVTCWGRPFYAGWGLTEDRLPCPRRRRRLTLDELVAGTLLRYPDYLDVPTGLPCEVEMVVDRLAPPGTAERADAGIAAQTLALMAAGGGIGHAAARGARLLRAWVAHWQR